MNKEAAVKEVFDFLINYNVNFILLRGGDDILENVSYSNDIDLLCNLQDKDKLVNIFKKLGYGHYQDSFIANDYLYFALPHEHFIDKKRDLHFDIVFNLSYRSPNKGEWVSVDEAIQNKIWLRKKKVDNFWKYEASFIDEYVHIVCHAIFDKKDFAQKYIHRLEKLQPHIEEKEALFMFELIFFKYAETLVNQLMSKNFDNIIKNYMEFKDY